MKIITRPKPCLTASHVRTVEIISGVTSGLAEVGGSVSQARRNGLAGLLGGCDLALELDGTLVDELQLREVGVEDADDLGDLYGLAIVDT